MKSGDGSSSCSGSGGSGMRGLLCVFGRVDPYPLPAALAAGALVGAAAAEASARPTVEAVRVAVVQVGVLVADGHGRELRQDDLAPEPEGHAAQAGPLGAEARQLDRVLARQVSESAADVIADKRGGH